MRIFFELDRNAVKGGKPLAILRCYDLIRRAEALPPKATFKIPAGWLERELYGGLDDEDDFARGQA
jgi:hypothetical protein